MGMKQLHKRFYRQQTKELILLLLPVIILFLVTWIIFVGVDLIIFSVILGYYILFIVLAQWLVSLVDYKGAYSTFWKRIETDEFQRELESMKIMEKQFDGWTKVSRIRHQSKPIVVTEHYILELGEKIMERSSIQQWEVRTKKMDGRNWVQMKLRLQGGDWCYLVFRDMEAANEVAQYLK